MNITVPIDNNARPGTARSISLEKAQTLQSEKKRLYKATRNMESLFLYQLLKSMRQTIPKTELSRTFGTGGGLGEDIYTQMFDQELAGKMAGSGVRSIADVLYSSLERVLEQQFNDQENADKNTIKRILPENRSIKVANKQNQTDKISVYKEPATTIAELTGKYGSFIKQAAARYRLNPSLIAAVIKAESNGDARAVSSAGAKGLMQLIDTTAADMGVRDVFNPQENIEGGAKYLRKLLDRFGDVKTALAAYNAGPETVKRYGGIPPYPETISYVRSVMEKLVKDVPDQQ